MSQSTTSSSSDLLIQSVITIVMIFAALILGDIIQPWGTKVSLSILRPGGEIATL